MHDVDRNSQNTFLEKFFNGKRVLITGHTGFKGSWLALWLESLGASITGFSLPPPTQPSHFSLVSLEDRIRHIEGDIRELQALHQAFRKTEPEIVFHLAAQAIVRDSYEDPKHTFDVNVGGTVNVLEAIRSCGSVKAAIIVTSDKCYENNEWVWGYRETDPLGGADPYSASKGAAEIICSSYRRSFFHASGDHATGIATVRAGNVIGGGDWAKDRIIPDIVRALTSSDELTLRHPDSIRPWQHVLEPLSGYLYLASQLYEYPDRFSGPWNFGPYNTANITVGGLAGMFSDLWQHGPDNNFRTKLVNADLHEAHFLCLSIDKALYRLRWCPIMDVVSAIGSTVAWYKKWHEGAKGLRDVSLGQITEYISAARRAQAAWARHGTAAAGNVTTPLRGGLSTI